MIPEQELRDVLGRLSALLEALKIPYHCTGGIAVGRYGDPRSTQDLDIVLRLLPGSTGASEFMLRLQQQYLTDPDRMSKAIESFGMFQAMDGEHYIKIDFYNRELVPGELDRSVRWEVLPGVVSRVVCREDAILSKLVWIQKGSHRSRRDVVAMLRNPQPLDWPALRHRADHLGLSELLKQLYERSRQVPTGDDIDL